MVLTERHQNTLASSHNTINNAKNAIKSSSATARTLPHEKKPAQTLQEKYGVNPKLPVKEYDKEDMHNERYCAEYVSDVVASYLQDQEVFLPAFDYMTKQKDINSKMRELLVDWLIQVHQRFQLSTHTLFLGVALLDRFLSEVNVKRDKLQLVGCCTMWIASKFEEIFAPEVEDFVTISDRSFCFQDMVKAEKFIVDKLEFKLKSPTTFFFLRRMMKVMGCSELFQHIAGYVAEFSLQRIECLKYTPATLAASILLFALSTLEHNLEHNRENVMNSEEEEEEEYEWIDPVQDLSRDEVMEIGGVQMLQNLIMSNESSSNRSVFKKYSSQKFMFVSKLEYDFTLSSGSEDEENEMETE